MDRSRNLLTLLLGFPASFYIITSDATTSARKAIHFSQIIPKNLYEYTTVSRAAAARAAIYDAFESTGPIEAARALRFSARACAFGDLADDAGYAAACVRKDIKVISAPARRIALARLFGARDKPLSPEALFGERLWNDTVPCGAIDCWNEFQQRITSLGQGFDVWLDWYRDRLEGRPVRAEVEGQWATVSTALLSQSTTDINAYLRSVREGLSTEQPEQVRAIDSANIGRASLIKAFPGEKIAAEKAIAWQSRPIFISSTFADMQAERDVLQTHVFPALEERLKTKRRHLEWVDLRIGVATAGVADEEARELQVLKVCLAEVKRCRPFLLVLLGDRYGWVPREQRIRAAAQEEGISATVDGQSVTDLEIRYGTLGYSDAQPRCFFYFRDPLPYNEMPPQIAALHSEAHDGTSGAADRLKNLVALKAEIERLFPSRVKRYSPSWDRNHNRVSFSDLIAWGRQVVEDIWSDLDAAMALDQVKEPTSWQEAERLALDDYVEDRARGFVGRDDILVHFERLAGSPAAEGAAWGAVLTGPPGAGKSAIFGELYRRLKNRETFVLAHAASASARSRSVEDMLRRWIEELGVALGARASLAEDATPETIQTTFRSLLRRVAERRRVVVMVEALDQFEATTGARFVTWLPRLWPENARIIATAIPGEASNALAQRSGIEVLALPPLDADSARRIAAGICARYHRTMEPQVLDALLAKRDAGNAPAWGNPLWLVLAVEELNLVDADDFARARRVHQGQPAEQLRALMLDIVAELPADIISLYGATFDRAEELYGRDLARAFLGLIAVSRGGWRESDFKALVPRLVQTQSGGEPWDELHFASLRRLFRGQIRQHGILSQWDFNHAQMRTAARRRLAISDIPETRFHAEAADHLLSLSTDDPLRVSETMLHLLGSENWPRAAAFYGDLLLTQPEIDGATRILADAVLTAKSNDQVDVDRWREAAFFGNEAQSAKYRNASALRQKSGDQSDGLNQIRRLLDTATQAAGGDAAVIAFTLARRILFELDRTLENRARLATRADLVLSAGQILDNFAKAHPENFNWQRDVASVHVKIGHLLREQGYHAEASLNYTCALRISERLANAEPGNLELQVDIFDARVRVAEALLRLDNIGPARDEYQAALVIAGRILKQQRFKEQWHQYFRNALSEISYQLFSRGAIRELYQAKG